MVTFLLDLFVLAGGIAGRVNWWVHMLVIYTFLVLIPNSKHLHLLLSPATVFLKAPVLGTVPNLDFEKEEVGLETREGPAEEGGARRVHLRRMRPLHGELPGDGHRQAAQSQGADPAERGGAAGGRARHEARRRVRPRRAVAVHDVRRLRGRVSGRHRAHTGDHRRPTRAGQQRRGARVPGAGLQQPRAARQPLGPDLGRAAEVRRVGAVRDVRSREARVPALARLRWRHRARLPEVAAIAGRDPARAGQDVRRAEQGTLHGRRRQAHRQRVPVPGTGRRPTSGTCRTPA